jgi:hypothetical protein
MQLTCTQQYLSDERIHVTIRPWLPGNHATQKYLLARVSMKPTVVLGMAQPYPGHDRCLWSNTSHYIICSISTSYVPYSGHVLQQTGYQGIFIFVVPGQLPKKNGFWNMLHYIYYMYYFHTLGALLWTCASTNRLPRNFHIDCAGTTTSETWLSKYVTLYITYIYTYILIITQMSYVNFSLCFLTVSNHDNSCKINAWRLLRRESVPYS